jgi:hypothetical protein
MHDCPCTCKSIKWQSEIRKKMLCKKRRKKKPKRKILFLRHFSKSSHWEKYAHLHATLLFMYNDHMGIFIALFILRIVRSVQPSVICLATYLEYECAGRDGMTGGVLRPANWIGSSMDTE